MWGWFRTAIYLDVDFIWSLVCQCNIIPIQGDFEGILLFTALINLSRFDSSDSFDILHGSDSFHSSNDFDNFCLVARAGFRVNTTPVSYLKVSILPTLLIKLSSVAECS